MNIEILFIIPVLLSFFVSYALTPLVIRLAWKFDLIDDPEKNKHEKVIHKKKTPRAGGLAIFLSIIVSILFLFKIDQHLIGIILGLVVLVIVGILDDKYNLNPYLRILLLLIATSMPIVSGIGIAFINNPITGQLVDLSYPRFNFTLLGQERSFWILSDLFAFFWIFTLMNFINWGAKGVDGQLSGVMFIASLTIAILSLRFSADVTEWPVSVLASITAGAFLGFLPYHKYPQKIMPGFSGSTIGGYMLGVLSILTTTKVGILAIVLAVPLIDSGYTVIRRLLQGKSPVWGDRGHLHHRLLDKAGLTKPQIAYFYWIATAVLGGIALFLNSEFKLYTIIGLVFLIGGLILWLTYRPK